MDQSDRRSHPHSAASLNTSFNKVQITDHRPQTTGHRPQTTDHRPQATDHRPQATDHRPQATDHRPQATDHRPQTTGHRPHPQPASLNTSLNKSEPMNATAAQHNEPQHKRITECNHTQSAIVACVWTLHSLKSNCL
jgi:CD68 antigen